VKNLNEAIKKVDGGFGFTQTPMFYSPDLNTFIKDETNNVAQSHKARHLFNLMVYLLVLDELAPSPVRATSRLAVASCGNAGLAAATIASASNWPIDVCVPENVDEDIISKLRSLGTNVNIVKCPADGHPESVYLDCIQKDVSTIDASDPTVSVFMNLVEKHGSIPFSVQGSECGLAVEGVQTIAWEIIEQAAGLRHSHGIESLGFSSLFIQVGGGALGSGIIQGFQRAANTDLSRSIPNIGLATADSVPSLVTVQAEGNAPLRRAYSKMKENDASLEEASKNRAEYMYSWKNPTSIAYGILDNETYDWVELVKGMESTNGDAIVVDEDTISKANAYAKSMYKINSCLTGSVGLAGLMYMKNNEPSSGPPSICVLSGKDRSMTTASTITPPQWTRNGIHYRILEPTFDANILFKFNKTHGSSPLNFIPDEPVIAHFGKLKSGKTKVWGAFDTNKLVGILSAEIGGDYWLQTGDRRESVCFVNEFVVRPDYRGRRIGVNLTAMSIDPSSGIFSLNPSVTEMYTTVHVENITSRTAFIKGGYREVITYKDTMRKRDTTVLKFTKNSNQFPRGNSQTMRIVGIQSGNAVDGIDVGIFDFEPLVRSKSDQRALAGSLRYKVVANKTFPFTPEERQYVLGLRAMRLEDGNGYAKGNYKMGGWFARRVNDLLAETGIDKSEIALIGSHGQTVSGHPHWELGDISVIAQQTGITVAGNFRPADVAAGGNGTPCTCTYDSIMLRPEAGGGSGEFA
jgi:threonine synthase